jgi:tetraacyldisaccharide 4'-kinase
MNQNSYKKIISGQSKGFAAPLLRLLLYFASFFYAAVIAIRNFFYSTGLFKTYSVNAAVISIGNITAGGTGKTPLVIWLCNFLRQQNIPSAVLTRGYKSAAASPQLYVGGQCANRNPQATDEPALIADSCPDVPVIVNPDRIAGAKEAIEKFNAKALILDDGFQHRRLSRNLDIVTIDAAEPFGFGRLLPAGLLREPASSLKRADAVVITHSDLIGQSGLNHLQLSLQKINPRLLIVNAIHHPAKIHYPDSSHQPPDYLKSKNLFAFCGIGNSRSFFQTLEKLDTHLAGSEIYDDHYHYTHNDISSLCQKAKQCGADLIITTQKDWTKIKNLLPAATDTPLACLQIELKITDGEDKFRMLIKNALAGKISKQ